jgi:GTP pyrophosphokinase
VTHHEVTLEGLRAAMAGRASADGLDRLPAAFATAHRAHLGQRRKSGDPYITHPLAVAAIVAAWDQPADVVLAALLHDVPDGGGDPQGLLADLTPLVGRATTDVLRATWSATHEELRTGLAHPDGSPPTTRRSAAVVMLADRLHNSRTWEHVPLPAARRKAAETLDVVVPLARRLGLSHVATELSARSHAVLGDGHRIVRPAVALVPRKDRTRYAMEWAADLAHTPPGAARYRLAAGLLWSALRMRASSLR